MPSTLILNESRSNAGPMNGAPLFADELIERDYTTEQIISPEDTIFAIWIVTTGIWSRTMSRNNKN